MKITIPGDPVAQGRPRFYRMGEHVQTVDPPKSRNWKATAQHHMRLQCAKPIPAKVPVELSIEVVFRCPVSDYRKRKPREWRWRTKRPDLDNVIKAIKDAGNGVLWLDDNQIVEIHASKIIAAQGEPPMILLDVVEIEVLT